MPILTDASPLVALLSDRDQYHYQAMQTAQKLGPETLITTFPCFTEASLQLDGRNPRHANTKIYDHHLAGTILLHYPSPNETRRAIELIYKYQDSPMSFADASLIAAAETLNQRRIFTYDSDFQIYRLNDRDPVDIIR